MPAYSSEYIGRWRMAEDVEASPNSDRRDVCKSYIRLSYQTKDVRTKRQSCIIISKDEANL